MVHTIYEVTCDQCGVRYRYEPEIDWLSPHRPLVARSEASEAGWKVADDESTGDYCPQCKRAAALALQSQETPK